LSVIHDDVVEGLLRGGGTIFATVKEVAGQTKKSNIRNLKA